MILFKHSRWLITVAVLSFSIPRTASAVTVTFGSLSDEFRMEFVTIGDPANVADTTGNPNLAGAVMNQFSMGKFEVSLEMVTKANDAGGLGISLNDMWVFGANGTNRPATGVSWNEAARLVNWLNVSSGF
jgi:formylglycine-generating enzyme required for sulfatase activity